MAIDEAILSEVEKGASPSTLRFYGWKPPAVSLGTGQASDTVDGAACRDLGIDVVRRPTGGGALLHQEEVTYSFCALNDGNLVPRTLLGSYDALCRGIEEGLRLLDVECSRGEEAEPAGGAGSSGKREESRAAICFLPTSRSDILAGGKKLVGSAQKRTRQAFLQHGSVLLGLDRELGRKLFGDRAGAGEGLFARATCLEEVLGKALEFGTVMKALSSGFEGALGIRLVPGELSRLEQDLAAELARDKYRGSRWTRAKRGCRL